MNILDCITSPVVVITAKSDERINGMTAAWIMQCSFSPAMVAVSIAPERFTYELIRSSGKFAVNILARDQHELAKKFGMGSGRVSNKFEGFAYETSERLQLPVLKGCYGLLECSLEGETKAGDHQIIYGTVVNKKIDTAAEAMVFRAKDFF